MVGLLVLLPNNGYNEKHFAMQFLTSKAKESKLKGKKKNVKKSKRTFNITHEFA